jgi:uncharacterized protein (DUF58 family)
MLPGSVLQASVQQAGRDVPRPFASDVRHQMSDQHPMNLVTDLRSYFQRRFNRWLDRRIPSERRVLLDRRRIFILPSPAGFIFLGVVVLLWLVATNYQNNLVFAFAALLGSLFVVAIFHSYANLAGLQLFVDRVEPTFAGHKACVRVVVEQGGRERVRDDIRLSFAGSSPVVVTLAEPGTSTGAELFVPAPGRGWLTPGRLRVESHYPLGLLRVWTRILPECRGLVYPKPVAGKPQPPGGGGGEGDGVSRQGSGADDFVGLEKYRPGDSLNRVAWKQQAQGRGMLTKHYGEAVASSQWLDWDTFPGLGREARLSRLCHWLLAVSEGDQPYGLRLPDGEIPPALGPRHRDQLLARLALFEVEQADERHRQDRS